MKFSSNLKAKTPVALTVLLVGMLSPTVAFAATNMTPAGTLPTVSIGVNGKTIGSMPVFMNQSGTHVPLWYVMKALNQSGIKSTWNGWTWNLMVPKTTTMQPLNLPAGSGMTKLTINGHLAGTFATTVAKDPFSGHMTTFLSESVLTQVLSSLGLSSGIQGHEWWVKTSSSSMAAPAVATITANKTAQTLQGASSAMSTSDEATFVVTALTANGKPAANEPVTFYIGPMTPLSGIPPQHWYSSASTEGSKYIASMSKTTNDQGQATLVLYGQPAGSMEMIGVQIGNLSTYSTTAMKAVGSLDAWWTSPTSKATAPIGDYVTVSPFATTLDPGSKVSFHIDVQSPNGPVAGAHVSISSTMKSGSSTSMSTSSMSTSSTSNAANSASSSMGNSMSTGSSMSSTSGSASSMTGNSTTTLVTNSMGMATYTANVPAGAAMLPIRVVATQPSNPGRISGGLNMLWVSPMN
ncbi:hypothetical protein LLE49_18175 [Alicyclobacillus tolerans]|uniref:hypothetical protein n=1 Tax=Alicyclobacillus tolerans TaxID=90970 RepID=UPI001F36186C|nr:hypothetical protein [Alicyclobacillus tolerans]MCF8566655.1 hypothetical protein [Alicyclobacillus tolerans]